jgi:uncharacterized protein (TIGR02246 family)
MKYRILVSTLLGFGLAACAPEAAEETATEDAATQTYASADVLAEVRSQYVEHYNLGHAPAVADLYTEDAVYMPAGASFSMGREAIAGILEASIAGSPTIQITSTGNEVLEDVAFEHGTYGVEMTPEGADPVAFSGHYITFSKLQADGSWKLHWVISNYDAEPGPEVVATMPQELAAQDAGGDPVFDGLRAEWQAAYNQADGATVAAMHTADGATMFANQSRWEGSAGLAGGLEEAFAASPQNEITQVAVEVHGDWAVNRGFYEQQASSPEGEAVSQSGYYMYVARKDADGSWKIHWLVSNAVAPPM